MTVHREINLFPWRHALQKRKLKSLWYFLLMALVLAMIVIAVWLMLALTELGRQNQRNAFFIAKNAALKTQISTLNDLKDEKAALLHRIALLNRLRQTRAEELRVWVMLTKVLPEHVYLLSVRKQGEQLILEGRAGSSKDIAALMKNLTLSQLFGKPKLSTIKLVGEAGFGAEHTFKITLAINVAGEKRL